MKGLGGCKGSEESKAVERGKRKKNEDKKTREKRGFAEENSLQCII